VRRVIGGGDLRVIEYILTYDGKSSSKFSGDELHGKHSIFADPFEPRLAGTMSGTNGNATANATVAELTGES
jgi:hypothetical protein